MGDVLADNRIAALFDKARKEESKGRPLSARLVAQLCVVAGGDDCGYGGKSMTDAQSGMKITSAQWDAFVEDLGIALKTRSIDDATARELIDKLTQQTRADLVTKPGRP